MKSYMDIQIGLQLFCSTVIFCKILSQSISPLVTNKSNPRLASSISFGFSSSSSLFSIKSLRATHGSTKHFLWWSHAYSWFFIFQNMGPHPLASYQPFMYKDLCVGFFTRTLHRCVCNFCSDLIVI